MATTKIPIGQFPIGTKVITVDYDAENDVILNQEAIFEKMEGIPYKDIIFEVFWFEIDGGDDADVYFEYLRFSDMTDSPNHGDDDVSYYYYTFKNNDYFLYIKDLFDTKTILFRKIYKIADEAKYASQDTSKGTIEQRLAALEALLNNQEVE